MRLIGKGENKMTRAQHVSTSTEDKGLKKNIELYFSDPLPLNFDNFSEQVCHYSIYDVTIVIPQLGRTHRIRTNRVINDNWSIYSIGGDLDELLLNYSWCTLDSYYSIDDLLEYEIVPLQLAIETFLEGEGVSDYRIQVTLSIEEG